MKHHDKKTSTKKVDPLIAQAQQAGQVVYGPQFQALGDLADQAQSSYQGGVTQAQVAGQGIQNATKQAAPGLADFLSRVNGYHAATQAKVGPTAEGQAVGDNLNLTAGSLGNLLQQTGVRAAEASAFQQNKLRNDFSGSLDKINSQNSALKTQLGNYVESKYGDLVDTNTKNKITLAKIKSAAENAAASRSVSRANALLSAKTQSDNASLSSATQLAESGVNADGSVIPGGKADAAAKAKAAKASGAAAGKKWAPDATQGRYQDGITKTLNTVKTVTGGGKHLDRQSAAGLLLSGIPADKGAPGIPAQNPLFTSVALDLVYDGHISKHNATELHRRKIKVNALGFPVHGAPGHSLGLAAQGLADNAASILGH